MGDTRAGNVGGEHLGVLLYILGNYISFHKYILFLEFEHKVFVNSGRCPEVFILLL